MSAIQEIREENARKLQSEAINRYMMLKETEIELAIDTTERYKSVCVGLIISLVLVLSGTGYCLYYIDNMKCEYEAGTKYPASIWGYDVMLNNEVMMHYR